MRMLDRHGRDMAPVTFTLTIGLSRTLRCRIWLGSLLFKAAVAVLGAQSTVGYTTP